MILIITFLPWIDFVKPWLCDAGFLNECLGFSTEYIKNAVKLRVDGIHLQEWSIEKSDHKVCDIRLYDSIKQQSLILYRLQE